ncbi:MAG: carbon-nitrogen hydrolase family protein [Deltaproteobacteria bacterium]|nr:carbon-nitrogen hydrolase family protein [Deltaproteobacteria bacterium]
MKPTIPSAPLEIAVAQLNAQDDVEVNLATIAHLGAHAAKVGARVLSLPEGCAIMGEQDKKRASAEPIPAIGERPEGKILGAFSALARLHSLWVFAGGVALQSGDPLRPYNAHLAFAPNGEVKALYRKIHLFDVDLPDGTSHRESDSSGCGSPAEDIVVLDVEGWRVGLSICYDLRFPELFRAHVDRDAHAILIPAAFTVPTGKDHWHVLMRARAIESQCYVAAAAQWGRHPGNRLTYGKSLIADPWGDVIAQASDGVGLARATLDPKRLADVRGQVPSLRHRRF